MDVDWGDDVQPVTPDRQPSARQPKRTEDQLDEPDPEEEKQRNLQRERAALLNLENKFGGKEKFFDVLQCDAKLVDTTDPTDTAALPVPANPDPHWQTSWQQRKRARQGGAQAAGLSARR